MKKFLTIAGLAAALALISLAAPAQDVELPKYVPPQASVPEMRVGSGTRGLRGTPGGIQVSAIAPGHIAQSLRPQPKLYWVLDRPDSQEAPAKAEITLSEINLESRIDSTILDQIPVALPANANGIQMIDLKNYNANLKPGVDYAWAVAIENPQAGEGASVLIADGWIRHVAVSPELESCLANQRDRVLVYAACGLWYDAIAELFSRLSANPQDSVMQAARNALLEQIGIALK